jgi:hypothetical protein
MSTGDTRQLLAQAVQHFYDEVPALRNLALVARVELRARGDVPTWRVEVPGPKISKDPAADARLHVEIQRPDFNRLATEGSLREWQRAYDKGAVQVTGEPAIVKLLAAVIGKQLTRSR